MKRRPERKEVGTDGREWGLHQKPSESGCKGNDKDRTIECEVSLSSVYDREVGGRERMDRI